MVRFAALVVIFTAFMALLTINVNSAQTPSETDWPSLKFHFTVKRSSMKVHGQSKFSLSANPVVSEDGNAVLYEVFASFTEGTTVTNYTLLNSVAYMSIGSTVESSTPPSVECLGAGASEILPINDIVKAIGGATAMSSSSGSGYSADECSKGLFKVSMNGITFVLCVSGSTGFKLLGSDMDITVEYLKTDVTVAPPIVYTDSSDDDDCETVVAASPVTPIGKSLLTGNLDSTHVERNLEPEFFWNHEDENSCSCKSTKRPCLFIHGMGVDEEEPGVIDSFSNYWGNLTDHAPCCSSFKYTKLNTVDNAWTNNALQQKVCDRAVSVSQRSSKTVIADTIIITHSMGNLMVAGAIATGKCSLDSSSTWVGLAGPMKGSMASDFVQDTCAGETNEVLEKVANITGRCPANVALQGLPSQGGNHSSAELNAAYTAAQEAYTKNVSALMCSDGFSGLPSKYQAQFWVLGNLVPYKSDKNDGMVEFDSCAAGIPEEKFGDTWNSTFYKTKLNHYDSEFLYGDALLDKKKMPIKWFECLL